MSLVKVVYELTGCLHVKNKPTLRDQWIPVESLWEFYPLQRIYEEMAYFKILNKMFKVGDDVLLFN